METLEAFSGVPIAALTRRKVEGVEFLLPTSEQFLAIYRASSQDSYRNDNNNHKDFAKIAYLEKMTKCWTARNSPVCLFYYLFVIMVRVKI